jgi:hypothetical protein
MLMQSVPSNAATLNDALFGAVNSYRAARGLPAIAVSPTLSAAAQFMAEDVATYGPPYIPHVSTDGRTARQRMADAGYPVDDAFTSEIIAWGASSVAGALSLWVSSSVHWAQLNDGRFRAGGFGVACWGAFPCVWVVTLGTVVDATFAEVPRAPSHHAAFYTQAAYPTVSPGETAHWVIAFTNTGSTGWQAAATELHLGTNRPTDAPSMLAAASWLSANRPARQTTPYVAPGQQAWFIVDLAAPVQPGMYRLYVRPVIDGVEWLEDMGAYVDLTVR